MGELLAARECAEVLGVVRGHAGLACYALTRFIGATADRPSSV